MQLASSHSFTAAKVLQHLPGMPAQAGCTQSSCCGARPTAMLDWGTPSVLLPAATTCMHPTPVACAADIHGQWCPYTHPAPQRARPHTHPAPQRARVLPSRATYTARQAGLTSQSKRSWRSTPWAESQLQSCSPCTCRWTGHGHQTEQCMCSMTRCELTPCHAHPALYHQSCSVCIGGSSAPVGSGALLSAP
jgi:hypothetical protein